MNKEFEIKDTYLYKHELDKESLFIKTYIKQLEQENKQLKENWNKLKEFFRFLSINTTSGDKEFMEDIILFMEKLGQGSDNK